MKNNEEKINTLRDFPAVEILTADKTLAPYVWKLSRPVVTRMVKETVAELKAKFKKDDKPLSKKTILQTIVRKLDGLTTQFLTRVINGAGIIIHTNLGRSPLAKDMIENSLEAVTGYSNLEFDLNTGKRGKNPRRVSRF